MNTHIYIIRHGQTDPNRSKNIVGKTNVSLNEYGLKEVDLLRKHFEKLHIKPEIVITSPLKRAKVTALHLQSTLGGKMKTSKLLTEMDYGNYEGANKEILQAIDYGYNSRVVQSAGGDSLEKIEKRLRHLLEGIFLHSASCFFLITHAFTASVLQQILLNVPRDFAHIQPLATADYTHAVIQKGGEQIRLIAMQKGVLKGPLRL